MAQKFHGLALANNSTADNFHFERLALDPSVTQPGRLWFNTTDKVFKYSGLDTNGDITINVIGDSSALATFQATLTSETDARTQAIAAIQAELNAVETATGLEANGTFAAITGSNFIDSASNLKEAALALDAALKATETAVATEANTRAAADTAMQTQVDNLILASGDGSAVLKGTLNSGRYNVTSTIPALEHVITHNLNTAYYVADIKVEGIDLVYRNDIVPVEEIDLNSFRITLSEVLNVKVSVMSTAVLA
jgi:hypothetical protein